VAPRTGIVSAIPTPLDEDESLHTAGLEALLEDHWRAGVHTVLVGGTMGGMRFLTDDTHRALVEHAVALAAGRGEILVGVGDTCLARARQWLEFVNTCPADGVVVLPPSPIELSQDELADYFLAAADASAHPVFLYDLSDAPGFENTELALDTVERLAQHPNIQGIKNAGVPRKTRLLVNRLGDRIRIIACHPDMMDVLIPEGITEFADGLFWTC
jgi:4-hydroxy-tetrahydrodipicolinate synthase